MQVAVASVFRDSESYVHRYADQIQELREAAPEYTFRLLLLEGDSSDASWDVLKATFGGSVLKRAHGGPAFGSVENDVRFRQQSWVYEANLARVLPEDDIFVHVEADLIWQPETMLELFRHLEKPGVDLVSPFCWYQGRHYDTWAFRGLDGVKFGLFPPFHTCMLNDSPSGLYPLSGAGSCIAMKAEVARTCHMVPPELVTIGLVRDAISKGYRAWLDPKLKVRHP